MNENMKFEKLNLAVTILTPIVAALIGGWLTLKIQNSSQEVQAHSDANLAALKQSITESFETQAAHAADVTSLKQWNQTVSQNVKDLSTTVQQNNVEQRLAIQHLGDKLDSISTKQNNGDKQ